MSAYTLHLGDCLDVMRGMDAGSVDAVVTDPPYNVSLSYASYEDDRPDYAEWCGEWFAELRRICKGPIAISVGQANLSEWARIAPPDWWLAWWKPAAMGRCVVGFNNWEPIALYGKPAKAGSDVIRAIIKPDDSIKGHPCPKPLDWAIRQVVMLTDAGATVLDPFMGSGTTGVACIKTGRRFIGIEIDPTYFSVAKRRIEDAAAQPSLFEMGQLA